MNGRVAKAIRKMTKRHGVEYLREMRSWPFGSRLSFAWWLVFGDKKRLDLI